MLLLVSAFTASCNNEQKKAPVTDIEVANTFVRDLLDNNFTDAEAYLLKDETNNQLFERFKKQYNKQNEATLAKYKQSDIIVNETSYVADSIFIFNYSNTFNSKDKTVLKLVRMNGKWLVDLKYTFSGNL